MSNVQNSWPEHSKLVFKELETLTKGFDLLKDDVNSIKHNLLTVKNHLDRVDELHTWRSRIDDIASPTQLKEHIDVIKELKTFKIKAITIFAMVQFFMGVTLWLQKIS